MPGPPIRTPSDHSPPAGSPRLIAGHHVLHRPLMPRHPPNAQKNKHTTQPRRTRPQSQHKEQRYSRPLYRSQPTRPHAPDQPPNKNRGDQPRRAGPQPGRTAPEPDSMPPTTHPPHQRKGGESGDRRPRPPGHPDDTRTRSSCSQPEQPHRTRPDHPNPPHTTSRGQQGGTPNHAQQKKNSLERR